MTKLYEMILQSEKLKLNPLNYHKIITMVLKKIKTKQTISVLGRNVQCYPNILLVGE